MASLGGVLGFASTAGAISPPAAGFSPVQDVNGIAGQISVAAPFIYAIPAGASGAPAANWLFQLNDNASSPVSNVWQNGDDFLICVSGGTQNVADNQYVSFASTPTVVVANPTFGGTVPSFAVVTLENPSDVSNDVLLKDCMDIHFLNSGDGVSLTNPILLITGITYNTGSATPVGTIGTLGVYTDASNSTLVVIPPNAAIVGASVSANNPPVSVLPNAVNAPISPINISETSPGTVLSDSTPGDLSTTSQGFICVIANSGKFTGSPHITLSPSSTGGTATVTGIVNIVTVAAGPNAGDSALVAQVLGSSTTTPTTFTFSNLTVDAPANNGPVTAQVLIDDNSQCNNPLAVSLTVPGSLIFDPIAIYTVGSVGGVHGSANGSIFGSTSEQTAVAALENQFPPIPGGTCLPQNNHPRPGRHDVGSTIILTVDSNDGFDALTASYLASFTTSGVLLTEADSNTVDQYTMNAIQAEGATTVIIVGGPAAVSNADQTELENTPSYQCGGTVQRTNGNGGVIDLQVQRIWGQTADATAAAVATSVNTGFVNSYDISGAFGQYNDTTGTDSGSSNNIPQRTAILSTDLDSQDAESASSMSYWEQFPILLTPKTSLGPDAATALLDLGIQQVIELGGPLAIADSVNSQLAAMGIQVIRIAGQDGSDTSVQLAKFELNSGTTSNGQPEGLNTDGDWSNDCTNLDTAGPDDSPVPHNAASPENEDGFYFANCGVDVALVRGDFFADGITSSVVTGNWPMPVLLTESPSSLGQYLTAFFNTAGSPEGIDPVANPTAPFVPYTGDFIDTIQPFGGPLALNASTIQAALTAIAAGASPA
jgi:putative cell wall-binding protein